MAGPPCAHTGPHGADEAGRALTLIVLANTGALWWDNSLARAEVVTSPVAAEFLSGFVGHAGTP